MPNSADDGRNGSRQRSSNFYDGYDGSRRPFSSLLPVCSSMAMATGVGTAPYHLFAHPSRTSKRFFGISRHPDPLVPQEDRSLNTLVGDDDDDIIENGDEAGMGRGKNKIITADDLEYDDFDSDYVGNGGTEGGLKNKGYYDYDDQEENYVMSRKIKEMGEYAWDDEGEEGDYDDIFGEAGLSGLGKRHRGGGVDEDDEEALADKEYREKQQRIKEELDKRTGRLWTDEWVIPDEEWMSMDTFDDIEEWKPELATRKSLESIKLFEGELLTNSLVTSIVFLQRCHKMYALFFSLL